MALFTAFLEGLTHGIWTGAWCIGWLLAMVACLGLLGGILRCITWAMLRQERP